MWGGGGGGMRGGGGGMHFGRMDRMNRLPNEENPEARLEIGKLVVYLRPHLLQVAATLLISVTITLLHLAPPRLIGSIIDQAVARKALSELYRNATLLLTVYICAHVLSGLKGFLIGRLGQRVIYDLWQDVYRNLQRLSFNFYDRNQTGSIMSRITNDVSAVERVIVDGIDTVIIAVMTLLGITVILFRLNWRLALVSLIPIPILLVLAWLVTQKAHLIYREVRRKMGEISALLQDSISGIREIKSFVREDYEVNRLAEKSSDYFSTNLQAIRLWSFFSPSILTTTSIGTFLVLLFGARQAVVTGDMSAGEIVSFLFYLGLFYQPIHQLNWFNHMLQHARAASERIFEIIDAVPQILEASNAVTLPRPVRGEVVFHDVSFSYQPDQEVLHAVNFEARPGELVALVGATGAGKTTIVSLIPRFYDADRGLILIDGIDVKKLKLHDLRENIGIVMQEPFLFNGTVMENIAYGRLEATFEEIVAAAKLANADQFINALPDGYAHQIGERGIKLSVGEKQRLAIARALLKNPPILILDEATSSVDNQTEALIQQAIDHLLRDRTSFVIAHRLSTVMHADKILVIDGGCIVESGTHDSLLAAGGVYARLYRIQWRHFRSQESEGMKAEIGG